MFPDQGTKAFRAISICFNTFESTRIIKLILSLETISPRENFLVKLNLGQGSVESVYFPFPPLLSREFYSYKENWARVG